MTETVKKKTTTKKVSSRKVTTKKNMSKTKKKSVPKNLKVSNIAWYCVIFLTDNTIHLWPLNYYKEGNVFYEMTREDANEDCEEIAYLVKLKKTYPIKTYKLIKRDLTKCKDGLIL